MINVSKILFVEGARQAIDGVDLEAFARKVADDEYVNASTVNKHRQAAVADINENTASYPYVSCYTHLCLCVFTSQANKPWSVYRMQSDKDGSAVRKMFNTLLVTARGLPGVYNREVVWVGYDVNTTRRLLRTDLAMEGESHPTVFDMLYGSMAIDIEKLLLPEGLPKMDLPVIQRAVLDAAEWTTPSEFKNIKDPVAATVATKMSRGIATAQRMGIIPSHPDYSDFVA